MTDPPEETGQGRQYHLDIGPDDVAETALLPGDPDRIDKIRSQWDESTIVGQHREYRTATGVLDGLPLMATSTGIGSPSAAIAVEELARVGVRSFIRVGSCGTIREDVSIGDLVITSGAIRGEGTSDEYVRRDYPAAANHLVVGALVRAAEDLEVPYHVGTTLSTDSFYVGQDRSGFQDYKSPRRRTLLSDLKVANVTNIEMEASAILTIASLYGLRAGAVCTVYANRTREEFEAVDDDDAAAVASRAAVVLARMDQAASAAGVPDWYPGLGL